MSYIAKASKTYPPGLFKTIVNCSLEFRSTSDCNFAAVISNPTSPCMTIVFIHSPLHCFHCFGRYHYFDYCHYYCFRFLLLFLQFLSAVSVLVVPGCFCDSLLLLVATPLKNYPIRDHFPWL